MLNLLKKYWYVVLFLVILVVLLFVFPFGANEVDTEMENNLPVLESVEDVVDVEENNTKGVVGK
jgi:signal peptidase I